MTHRRTYTLDHPLFAARTGAGVRVAVIDSGIHVGNPHVRAANETVCITADGETEDALDRIGHGTAVAAVILEKAPGIDLAAVRVFERSLATSAALLVRAIDWAVDHECRLINLSLGTPNAERADAFRAVVARAVERGAIVVSAHSSEDVVWFPGSLPGVVGITLDVDCARDSMCVDEAGISASGLPRPIPGVPAHRNLQGISFAVANATGFLARLLQDRPDVRTAADVSAALGFSSDAP